MLTAEWLQDKDLCLQKIREVVINHPNYKNPLETVELSVGELDVNHYEWEGKHCFIGFLLNEEFKDIPFSEIEGHGVKTAFRFLEVEANWRVLNLLEELQYYLDVVKCEWKDLLNQEFMETDQDD